MLPPPTISFTIPSIHDDLVLHCRIYHPLCLAPTLISHLSEWRKKAAIVAHPYAPLGGCYDDPVVQTLAEEILKQGFIVGTFNFRGAGHGHTTWSSRAEQDDYLSVVGFMIYYMHYLCPPPLPFDMPKFSRSDSELHDLTPIPSRALPTARHIDFANAYQDPPSPLADDERSLNMQPRLLLAGYSYGSLITTLLPPIVTSILPAFQTPQTESAHAEIRLRASSLATQQNQLISEHFVAFHNARTHRRGRSLYSDDALCNPKTRKSSAGVRMGGDENLRRTSQDSYRSRNSFSVETQEIVRKSVDRVRSIAKSRASPKRIKTAGSFVSPHKNRRTQSISSTESPLEDEPKLKSSSLEEVPDIGRGLQTAYILVSPLQGVVGSLATMWSSRSWRVSHNIPENEMKLAIDPSLVVFGDDDIFVGVSKLRSWSQRLAEVRNALGGSQFQYVEVEGAGHFWHDHGKLQILRDEVSKFVRGL